MAVAAVLCFSFSAAFVRLATSLSPYEITFIRLAVAAITVGAGLALTGGTRNNRLPLERRYLWYGLIAALHFLAFVTSLRLTSIAHALSITYTAPVFIALGSWWLLGERITIRQAAGIVITVGGIAILAGFQPRIDAPGLAGDGLALLSSLCFAAYSLAGRSERLRVGVLPYATVVYSVAALWLLPIALAGFAGFGRPSNVGAGAQAFTLQTVLAVVAAGFLPLGIGHTLYNASLRRIPATCVNLIASQEVTGGVLLGFLFLGEAPSANSIAGGMVALVGIALVLMHWPKSESYGQS